MEDTHKKQLREEYVLRLKNVVVLPLKLLGMNRFDISSNRQIIQKSGFSIFLSVFMLIMINITAFYTIYAIAYEIDYLIITEVFIVLHFIIFHNCVTINLSLVNRRNAARFFNSSVDLDVFLGVKETLFLRDIASNIFFTLWAVCGFSQIIISNMLMFTYLVPVPVYVAATILFVFLYCIYYDLVFLMSLYVVLTLRVRYMNVALMKLANMKPKYLADQFPFNSLFWVKKLDDLVDFHIRAKPEDFIQAYKMIFNLLHYLEGTYRFTDVELFRVGAITGWCMVSWGIQFAVSYQMGIFFRQLNQTSLICTYIQLKPTYPDEIYKMTSRIIRVLDMRDPRMSMYGFFYYDTGLLLRISSAVFVYITMQLQIAFPKNSDVIIVNNVTVTNSV